MPTANPVALATVTLALAFVVFAFAVIKLGAAVTKAITRQVFSTPVPACS